MTFSYILRENFFLVKGLSLRIIYEAKPRRVTDTNVLYGCRSVLVGVLNR